jgi:hypothetical protein
MTLDMSRQNALSGFIFLQRPSLGTRSMVWTGKALLFGVADPAIHGPGRLAGSGHAFGAGLAAQIR